MPEIFNIVGQQKKPARNDGSAFFLESNEDAMEAALLQMLKD